MSSKAIVMYYRGGKIIATVMFDHSEMTATEFMAYINAGAKERGADNWIAKDTAWASKETERYDRDVAAQTFANDL